MLNHQLVAQEEKQSEPAEAMEPVKPAVEALSNLTANETLSESSEQPEKSAPEVVAEEPTPMELDPPVESKPDPPPAES